jgi:hypothetical protein
MRVFSVIVVGSGLILGAAGQASATVIANTCAGGGNIYASSNSNGTETFPGTNVGTIGSAAGDTCQIGDLALYNGGSGGAFVNSSANPSNYEFYFAGGVLDITEEIGNNGTALHGIDVELDSLASETSTAASATLASINIPYTSGPSGFYTVSDDDLSAGWYTLSSYLAGAGIGDPNYQVDFSETVVTAVPEPASLALFGAGLLGIAALRRRRTTARGE